MSQKNGKILNKNCNNVKSTKHQKEKRVGLIEMSRGCMQRVSRFAISPFPLRYFSFSLYQIAQSKSKAKSLLSASLFLPNLSLANGSIKAKTITLNRKIQKLKISPFPNFQISL